MSNLLALQIYVINLEGATKRRAHIEKSFAEAGLTFRRVPAIDGKTFQWQSSDYSEGWYRCLHGREVNRPELGCYLSHLQALRTFLATEAPFALICEDDISLESELPAVLSAAVTAPRFWNVLRLSGLSEGRSLRVNRLVGDSWVCLSLARMKGTGAYLVDRKAARTFTSRLLPMKLPYDHALDREWFYGLRAATILPFPINQKQKRFGSSIQTYAQPKLSSWRRLLTTYPYQAFNESMRWLFRSAWFLALKLRKAGSNHPPLEKKS